MNPTSTLGPPSPGATMSSSLISPTAMSMRVM
jgi:hypothetical protein